MSDKNTSVCCGTCGTGACCNEHKSAEVRKLKSSIFCKTRVVQDSKSGIVMEPVCMADDKLD